MNADRRVRPPRLAEWLLARRLRADERAMVLGDLSEEFAAHAGASGLWRAKLAYCREAARLAWGLWSWAPRAPRRGGTVMSFDDLRYAVRRLRKQPLAAAVSVATLACAMGAAAATWSLVSAVLLNPVQVRDPERVVRVTYRYDTARGPRVSPSYAYPTYAALRDVAPMPLAAWGSIGSSTPLMVQTTGEPVRRSVRFATHDLWRVLGLQPAAGRFFTVDEDRRGAPLVALLSERFWRSEFQADPSVIGRVIRVRDHPVEIVGVGPVGFRDLSVAGAPDLILPLHSIDRVEPYVDAVGRDLMFTERPPAHWVEVVGRLPDGVTLEQMTAQLDGLEVLPNRTSTFVLNDVATAALTAEERASVTEFTRLLGTTVALLLLIGNLTVGMLLVLRTDGRRGELAMCLALGASRARLAAGVFAEALLLAGAGVILALPLSQILLAGINRFQLPGGIRVSILDLSLDRAVLAGVAAAGVLSVLLIAAVATALGLRRQPDDVLRSHSTATTRIRRRWSRSALVTAQVAVTLVLVTGAGLFARSVGRALSLNPGIDTSRLINVRVNAEAHGYDLPRAAVFYDALRARLLEQPAVASATLELSPSGTRRIESNGAAIELPEFMTTVWIDPQYLPTLGLPISTGRGFVADDRAGAPHVGIITASLARELAADGRAIGQRLGVSAVAGAPADTVEVVGVVPDFVWSVGIRPLRLYRPAAQQPVFPMYPGGGGRNLIVRAAGDVAAAMRSMTDIVRHLDPQLRLDRMTTVQSTVLDRMAPQRFGMTVMGALGGIALLLSVLGTWVLAESTATARRREMGIRAALGARGRDLRTLLLSETVRLVGVGLLLGFGLCWLGASTIRAFLFQVEPFDPIVTITVAGLIIGLALAVSVRPAITASRLDLARVLRDN